MDALRGEVNRWVGAPATGAGRLSAGAPPVQSLAGGQPSERCSEGSAKGCEVSHRTLKPAQFLRRSGSELRSLHQDSIDWGLTVLAEKIGSNSHVPLLSEPSKTGTRR